MYINKSRVQNVDKYLTLFKEDENVTVILTDLITFEKQLRNMGFSQEFDIGEQLLPISFEHSCYQIIIYQK